MGEDLVLIELPDVDEYLTYVLMTSQSQKVLAFGW